MCICLSLCLTVYLSGCLCAFVCLSSVFYWHSKACCSCKQTSEYVIGQDSGDDRLPSSTAEPLDSLLKERKHSSEFEDSYMALQQRETEQYQTLVINNERL